MPPHADVTRRLQFKRSFARTLRGNPTDAERKLWSLLRAGQLNGLRFRRQQPFGPYVADFFCASARLIIELDGEQHGADAAMAADAERTRFIEARGYRVLRFPNHMVLKEPQLVLEAILHAVKRSP